ncbi:hypothetical protein V8F33_011805 [Rhypophila sp. PSN 637]
MANYTSTVRYREPASLSHHGYRDPPVYSSSYNRRPIHVIDSSSIDSVRSISPVRDRHRDRLSEDLLNNPLTRRVLPALLSRSNDADGRPLKVVMNYGNLYLDDSAADQVSSYSSGYGGARRSGEQPNTVIYNAPGSTMAISSSGTGTSSIFRRPTSPLVRTVSPSDRFSSPERPRLRSPYRDTHFGQSASGGSGYYRDTYHESRSRSHSQDRYGAGRREQRRVTYHVEPGPPSPTYSSLSTITSSTMSASPPGRHRMSGANGPGVADMIDRRPMAMCLGCFKTMRVCSSGYCAACDFFPSSGGRGGGTRNSYERDIVIERERDHTPTRTSKTIIYGVGGDDLSTRRIRGVDMKGLGSQFKGLGIDGRKSRSRDRGRSREREIEFDVEIETGRDMNRNRDAVRELEKDRFRAKERAWERIEKEKRPGGPGRKGGADYDAGGIRARNGNGNGNGHVWDYSSDSDF